MPKTETGLKRQCLQDAGLTGVIFACEAHEGGKWPLYIPQHPVVDYLEIFELPVKQDTAFRG